MKDFMVIDQPAQIRAMADPKRIALLNMLVREGATVAMLASVLGEPHAKVYYHVKELERNGFVEVVLQEPRAGAPEKYYRAKARTYLLGLGLGLHGEVGEAAQQAAHDDLLRWRRQDVLGVDYRQVARAIIHESLGVSAGERVLVEGGPHQMELLQALVFEVWQAGGDAVLSVTGDDLLLRALSDLDMRRIQADPSLKRSIYGLVDCRIAIDPFADETLFAQIPEEKLSGWRQRERGAVRAMEGRSGRTVWIGFPTPSLAGMMGADYVGLYDAFWKGIAATPDQLRRRVPPDIVQYEPGRKCVVIGAEGSMLSFRLRADPEILDGRIPRKEGQWTTEFLPAGKIRLLMEAGSVEGVFSPDDVSYLGHSVSGLRLHVKSGQICNIEAREGEELFRQLLAFKGYAACESLSIGINPFVQNVVGYEFLDAVAEGAVTLTLAGPAGSAGLSFSSLQARLA